MTRRSRDFLGVAWFTLSVATALSSVFVVFVSLLDRPSVEAPRAQPTTTSAARSGLTQQIDELQEEQARMRQQLDALANAPQGGEIAARLAGLQTSSDDLAKRMSAIETAIVNDPAKALELPLLRRDVADLRERVEASDDNLHSEIDRVYDITKFTIGALAIGLLAQVLGSLLKGRDKAPSEK